MVKIDKVSIRNIANIADFRFSLGPVNVVSGKNGVGKSSIIAAISAALRGGSHTGMLRRGSSKGEVVLTLDRDGVPVVVTRRFSKKPSVLEVTEGGLPVAKPQGYLNEILDAIVSNPDAFKQATAKERVRIMLEASGVETPAEDLSEILDGWTALPEGSAAEVIDACHKRVHEARRVENKAARDHRSTVEELEASLPAEGEDFSARLEGLKAEAENFRAERERQRAAVMSARAGAVDAANARRDETIAAADEAERFALEEIERDVQPKITEAAAENARLEEGQRNVERARGVRTAIDRSREKWDAAESRSIKMDRQLEQLEELRARVLGDIKIEGVDVFEGEIRLNGIPFGSLSDSEKTKLSVRVARMRQPEAPIMLLDGMEKFDDPNWKGFLEHAEKYGIQIVAARVSEGPLKVEPNGKTS